LLGEKFEPIVIFGLREICCTRKEADEVKKIKEAEEFGTGRGAF